MDCEICCLCGKSVAIGTGYYTTREFDIRTEQQKKDQGLPYPGGDYLCMECRK